MAHSDQNLLHDRIPEKLSAVGTLPVELLTPTIGTQKNETRSPDRRYLRSPLPLKVLIQTGLTASSSKTIDVSPGGLSILSEIPMNTGTPLDLELSFGGVCYLNLSGQVVFCRKLEHQSSFQHHIGISFSRVRDWEQIILISSIKEVEGSASTRDNSEVTILLSPDKMALAASSMEDAYVSQDDLVRPQPSHLTVVPPFLQKTVENENIVPLSPTIKSHLALARLLPTEPAEPDEIPTLPLLVGGREIDTQVYKYCLLADKLLEEPRTAIKISKQLQAGFFPPNVQEFVFAKYCVGTKDLNRQALQAAASASQTYRYFPLSKRMQIASDIHVLLLEKKDALLSLMVKEGHPKKLAEWEFLGMEQAYRRPSLEFFKKELTRRIPSDAGELQYLIRRPDGVVGVCPPRNAPCSSSLIGGFALLAGNTMLVKPPLQSPASTLFLWKEVVHKALERNGAPPGTLNLILGNSTGVLEEWIHSPHINDILFIGGTKVGLEIGSRAFQSGKKPILELAGNDMMFVWKDADLVPSIQSLADGFLGSTQICMVPKKAFLHSDIYPAFESLFVEKVKTLRIGLPSDPHVQLCPVSKIAEFYEFLDDALTKGAELLCGGKRVNHLGAEKEDGRFITPAVLRIPTIEQALTMKCIQEENFFPLIPLVRVHSPRGKSEEKIRDLDIFNDMIAATNKNDYGLRISAWVKSQEYVEKFLGQLQNSGLLKINCRHIGFSPFLATHGGTRKSGGPFGELQYMWQKTSHLQGVTVKIT